MKALKKLSAILLTLIMVLGMAVNAFAAEGESENPSEPAAPATPTAQTFTLKIQANDSTGLTTGHEYNVYQIFTGDITEEKKADGTTERVLSNIRYGNSGWGKKDDPVSEEELKSIGSDAQGAENYAKKILASSTTLTPYCTLTGAINFIKEGVPAGYYLIVDDDTKKLEQGDAYSKYIVKVIDDVTVTPKSEQTSNNKVLYDDSTHESNVNDAGVGTVVNYKLTAKIAENAGSYDFYNFILADTLSQGLTFNNDIKVTIGDEILTESDGYALYTGTNPDEKATYADGYTFEVALKNAKNYAGKEVVVTYSATLNSHAVVDGPNENEYKVIYSNNPEHKYEGDKNNETPGKPLTTTGNVFGETPTKKTETYTTKLVLTKVDADNNNQKLKNATFKLTSEDANQTVVNSKEYYQLADGTEEKGTTYYYLLKDGTYTVTAPTYSESTSAEEQYIKVGKGDSKTTEGYIKVGEEYKVPDDVKQYIDQDLYMLKLTDASAYASTNKYVKKTATEIAASEKARVEMILTTGEDGTLTFDGLGTGNYVLKEVDAPDGYNYAADVEFNISFTKGEGEEKPTFKITPKNGENISYANGVISITIQDKSGSTLPSTGGIGTTLFYVIGGILVAGAGVLLITKRRMSAAE